MLLIDQPLVRNEIENFKGPLEESIPPGEDISKLTFVGEMNKEEKILWSLFSAKKKESNELVRSFINMDKDPAEMTAEEIAYFGKAIEEKATPEQKEKLRSLSKEGNLFYEALFESLGNRFIQKGDGRNVLSIRAGWKVYVSTKALSTLSIILHEGGTSYLTHIEI